MLLPLANFVMKSPKQAYLAALGFALLAVVFSPLGFFTGAIIALVTLRVSEVFGLKITLASIALVLFGNQLLHGNFLVGLMPVIEFMLPVWLLAVVLRRTNSLALTLQAAAILVGSLLVVAHLAIGDLSSWWLDVFNATLRPVMEEAGVIYSKEAIESTASLVTMMLGMFALGLWFGVVLLGRWMQGKLFYPGQFQEDFHNLKLPKSIAYSAIGIALASVVLNQVAIFGDLFGLMILVLMFQGLAVSHFVVKAKEWNRWWLVSLYILLAVLPQTVLLLAVIGLADQFSDFRNRLKSTS